eukprot:3336712-Amphidinium_carterae.1
MATVAGAAQSAGQAGPSIFCSQIAEHSSSSIRSSSINYGHSVPSMEGAGGVCHVRRGGSDCSPRARPEKRLSLVHRLEQEVKSMSMPARRRFVEEKTTQSPTERS